MKIFKNRYQASKAVSGHDKIVKVDGGYIVMSPTDYIIFKKQK